MTMMGGWAYGCMGVWWVDGPADGLCVEVGAHAPGAIGRASAEEERHCEGHAEPSRLEGRAAEEARLDPRVMQVHARVFAYGGRLIRCRCISSYCGI